jgi:spermidine synthase
MLPYETLDSMTTPEGLDLRLVRHGQELFILLDGGELMSTRRHGSEVALAEIGCRDLPNQKNPRVLIGGLGLGYTLRAALDVLPPGADVCVAEIFSRVVKWNRTHLADLQQGALSDRRTRIVEKDVFHVIGEGNWDAILLDTDNGPQAWCLEGNRRLYDRRGLEAIHQALVPRGTLAVWASNHDPRFVKLLSKSGFEASSQTARAHHGKGARYALFLAKKRGSLGRKR